MGQEYLFSSESVTEGHPDKLCDQIADAILDRCLMQDPRARVIAECAVAKGIVFIACRFAAPGLVDVAEVARQLIGQVGYTDARFNPRDCTVMTTFVELPQGPYDLVDEGDLDEAAIDRITGKNMANVFGYACRHTAAMIPLPIWLAHKLSRRLAAVRAERQLDYLGPDGKTQVGVEFRNRQPTRIHSVTLIASQNDSNDPSPARLRDDLLELVLRPSFADELLQPDERTQFFVNPEGPFINGGPATHSGLTGRKNADDTYGEYSRHSEAALSGKDPSRIDRVGAYAARHAAKNIVAAGLAEECEVELSYSIGQTRPLSVRVHSFGTGTRPDEELAALLRARFEFRPAGIVRDFQLRQLPARHGGWFYRRLAAYGHMGRMDLSLPWESTDKAEEMRMSPESG